MMRRTHRASFLVANLAVMAAVGGGCSDTSSETPGPGLNGPFDDGGGAFGPIPAAPRDSGTDARPNDGGPDAKPADGGIGGDAGKDSATKVDAGRDGALPQDATTDGGPTVTDAGQDVGPDRFDAASAPDVVDATSTIDNYVPPPPPPYACASGGFACNGECVDISLSPLHCGGCDRTCAQGQVCRDGQCTVAPVAEWRLDGDLRDSTLNGDNDGTMTQPVFVEGYAGKALSFDGTQSSMVVLLPSKLPLGATPRTVEAWVSPTGYDDPDLQGIVSYGERTCDSSGSGFEFGLTNKGFASTSFFCSPLVQSEGSALPLKAWSHLAFTYDGTFRRIFLNGGLISADRPTAAPDTKAGNLRIGSADDAGRRFKGAIDHVRIFPNARTSRDILDDATLVASLPMETPEGRDTGPNNLPVQVVGARLGPGQRGSALQFNGSPDRVMLSAVPGLGLRNQSFSISVWVNPTVATGAILHVSSNPDGGGWCMPFLGLDGSGRPAAQMWNDAPFSAAGPTAVPTSRWTHLVETWSTVNGLRLWVNGKQTAQTSVGTYAASGVPNYVHLATMMNGQGGCATKDIARAVFKGAIDELRIYRRELTAAEIEGLAQAP